MIFLELGVRIVITTQSLEQVFAGEGSLDSACKSEKVLVIYILQLSDSA